MLRYEVLFLTSPEITADETKSLEAGFESLVRSQEGNLLSFERWGKYKLSYEIRKNIYGVYFLARFEISREKCAELVEQIKTFFQVKNTDLVMRFLINALKPTQPLEYQRPESLEETPIKDVDTFLKENKMSGLISKEGFSSGAHASASVHAEE